MNKEVSVSVEALYVEYGERLNSCTIQTNDEGYYDLCDRYGNLVCMDGEVCEIAEKDDDGILLINHNGESDAIFYLTAKEAKTAGVDMSKTIAEQVMDFVAMGAKGSVNVSDDRYVGVYTFVPYGECKLAYNSYTPKEYGGQEFTPFGKNGNHEMELVGVVSCGDYLKVGSDPLIFKTDEELGIGSLDEQCEKFSEWATKMMQKRFVDNSIEVHLTREEYVDYLADKMSEDELLDYLEANIMLDGENEKYWTNNAVFLFDKKADGKPLEVAQLDLGSHGIYEAYVVEKNDGTYDACINENGTLVPISDETTGFSSERDAKLKADKFLLDTARSPRKTDRGCVKPTKSTKQDAER